MSRYSSICRFFEGLDTDVMLWVGMKKERVMRYCTIFLWTLSLTWGCGGGGKPSLVTMRIEAPEAGVVYPRIVTKDGVSGYKQITHKFKFEGADYSVSLRIDKAALKGAKETDKRVRMQQEISSLKWRVGLQWAYIFDPAQNELYSEILKALRKTKRRKKLDDDRYAELLAVFVQSIEYCNIKDGPAKYPIEIMGDGCGDCDDKSRLLAGLYQREGFDVSLFFFSEEQHMAVGIRTDGESFWDSGYAYIETTSPSYIGFPSYEYSDVKLTSKPEVMLLGQTGKMWRKSAQVSFLYETLNKERERAEQLKTELDEAKKENESLNRAYETLSKRLAASKGKLDPSDYNKLVKETNRAAKRFNDAVNDYNEIVKEINRSAEIMARIFDHPDDRHGVYKWVRKTLNSH